MIKEQIIKEKKKRKNPQGKKWHKLDNTGKIFPIIASENLSSVFRLSAALTQEVNPKLLQQALIDVLPRFPVFQVRLKRGFFWYYFEHNKRIPQIEEEAAYPCRYIDPKSNQFFLFRVSYYKKRVNLEVFHAVSDGLGAISFLKELVHRYFSLQEEYDRAEQAGGGQVIAPVYDAGSHNFFENIEDSYLKNYKPAKPAGYSTKPAYQLEGQVLNQGGENIVEGMLSAQALKAAAKRQGAGMTQYLTACLIWAVYRAYFTGKPQRETYIGVNLPVNLRSFFDSETTTNFFAVTSIEYHPNGQELSFEQLLEVVRAEMKREIDKDKFQEKISYNVSREKKWYFRGIPLFIKWLALRAIFKINNKAHSITLSNLGAVSADPEDQERIEYFQAMIGVSKEQPAKCAVCTFGDKMMFTIATVFDDSKLADHFFGKLKEDGVAVKVTSNGVVKQDVPHDHYPVIGYAADKWKSIVKVFYLTLAVLAVILGVVNVFTYSGLWWSAIAIPGIAYAALTLRYSILKHSNLGKSVLIQTLGMQALLVIIDCVVGGYNGWSVNFAVPGMILFADAAIVFLILLHPMNWQSYFMYQISITVLSFVLLLLWFLGVITRPFMAVLTVVISVSILLLTIVLGDRSVKNELIRRFHL